MPYMSGYKFSFGPVRGVEAVNRFLKSLPRGTISVALVAFTEYVIGNDSRGLKHYPSYKHVNRSKAYGQTFQSDKQRRWFWYNGGPSMIGDHRTGMTAKNWGYNVTKGGYGITITNPTEGAYYTMHDSGQARQPALVGWRRVRDVIHSNMRGAIQAAQRAVNAYLASK